MWKRLGKESAISAGKQGILQKECPTDMSKVKCFKCDQMGHIGANCKSPKARAKALPKAKPKANTKGSPRKTTKGKGGGKGKKGKLNEVGEAEEGDESRKPKLNKKPSSQIKTSSSCVPRHKNQLDPFNQQTTLSHKPFFAEPVIPNCRS